ncbi:TPA: hypothetical protein ACPZLR_002603 [Yersinia enterocolitica]
MSEFQAVIERLRIAESAFPASFGCGRGDGNYSLHCHESTEKPEFAIYKRMGDNFIIVDFFSELDDANKESLEILNKYPNWIASINCHNELHKKDIVEAKS